MKKRLTALALALAMVLGTTALAAGVERSISVTPMSLSINGQQVTPTKADGTPADVFAYDGATYVPLRYLSELLGIQVDWSAESAGIAKLEGEALKAPSAAGLKAGAYTGEAQGFGGKVKVTLTVSEGRIESVAIEGANETPTIGGRAIESMPKAMAAANSVAVDVVAGATVTSNAILTAARSAYDQAAGIQEAQIQVKMAPGVYTGAAPGFDRSLNIDVKVEVSETRILSIEVSRENNETQPILTSAIDHIVPRIIEHQSLAVDTITGATASSSAIRVAATQAVSKALAAGGSPASAINAFMVAPEKTGASKPPQVIDVDVLVVGMGGSGSSTAFRAVETMRDAGKPVSVLAIDKAAKYGGTSAVTSSMCSVNPKEFQKEVHNGEDFIPNPQDFRRDWLAYCEGDAKEELVDLMINNCGDMLDWMRAHCGFDFRTEPRTGFTGKDVFAGCFDYRYSGTEAVKYVTTGSYFDEMYRRYTDMGGKYMLETEAYKLNYDKATNTVTGVSARNVVDGTEYIINAKAVVSATGGFAGNAEMEKKYLSNEYYPLSGEWQIFGMQQNDGKVIQSAIDLGAGTYNIGMPPMVHICGSKLTFTDYEVVDLRPEDTATMVSVAKVPSASLVWSQGDIPRDLVKYYESLAVDTTGRRFISESSIVMHDPWRAGPMFYSIWSTEQLDVLAEKGFTYNGISPSTKYLGYRSPVPNNIPLTHLYEILDRCVDEGVAFKADTLGELAQKIGVDPDTLVNTVDTYNGYCETGVDEEWGKAAEYLWKVGEGPYYAVIGCSYTYCTCGALDINDQFQVLLADGKTPINGLYAVGLDSLGVILTDKKAYVTFGGVAQGWAYTSGYLAGEIVAKKAMGK